MKHMLTTTILAVLALTVLFPVCAVAQTATMDFEVIALGTHWGGPHGQSPGDWTASQDGINMYVEEFFVGQFVGFNHAVVGGKFTGYFPTTPLELNNISARFEFGGVGFPVNEVTIDYREFGGADNLRVNHDTLLTIDSLTALPTDVATGVQAFIDPDQQIRLVGPISSVQIGGQELAIDNVTRRAGTGIAGVARARSDRGGATAPPHASLRADVRNTSAPPESKRENPTAPRRTNANLRLFRDLLSHTFPRQSSR